MTQQVRAQSNGAITMIFGTASAMMAMLGVAIATTPVLSSMMGG